MTKRSGNTILSKLYSIILIAILIFLWQVVSDAEIIPKFMLPSPKQVAKAFIENFSILMMHTKITLYEAFVGLGIGIVVAFVLATIMDRFEIVYKAFYPLLIISQTIPFIAIAPLLVLWLGYDATPKVVLVAITTFFPIVIGLLEGFKSVDEDSVNLLKSMGAKKLQIFKHIKMPYALNGFFSGLKISVSYSVVGAVISEWLGGNNGLGVYMNRVRRSYSFDKMFAVIFLIIIISLILMGILNLIEKWFMPWKRYDE